MTTTPTVTLRADGPARTRAVAAALAPLCRVGDVLLLTGGLGSGKTTFAQGFGAALGVREPIVSPTFTLVRQYRLPDPDGDRPRQLLHGDLYRLSHRREVDDLGLAQLVEDGGVALVEWGEAAQPVLGDDWLRVDLVPEPEHESRRTIRLVARGGSWPARWRSVEETLAPWRTAS